MIEKLQVLSELFGSVDRYRQLFRVCYYYFKTTQDSEDALHDVYVKLYDKIEKGNMVNLPSGKDHLVLFIAKVIRNHYYESLRKSRGKFDEIFDLDNKGLIGIEHANIEKSIIEKLENLNLQIQAKKHQFTTQQIVLWNYVYDCTPVEDIARNMNLTRQNVWSQLSLLRKRIAKLVSLEEIAESGS